MCELEFIHLVTDMREAQCRYYRTGMCLGLDQVRTLECLVDCEIRASRGLNPQRPSLALISELRQAQRSYFRLEEPALEQILDLEHRVDLALEARRRAAVLSPPDREDLHHG